MKYFGYYADEKKQNSVNCTLAAINKMYYISTRIVDIDGKKVSKQLKFMN